MTPEISTHLSEEAMSDVLIGLASPESEAHLNACLICRGQLQAFRSTMQSFNQASLAWCQTRPSVALRAPVRSRLRPLVFAPATWALAAALLLVAGIPAWIHHVHSSSHSVSAPASVPENSEAQIAQDNDLLQSVNVALNESDVPPISKYYLSDGPHPQSKIRPELRNR
jgi:AcrR family transcriptional regulator